MTINRIREMFWAFAIWKDCNGQDLVEYALLAGFIAVAAGVFLPDVSTSMSKIYSRVASKLVQASA